MKNKMKNKLLSYSILTTLAVIASQSVMAQLDNPYEFSNDIPDIPFVIDRECYQPRNSVGNRF